MLHVLPACVAALALGQGVEPEPAHRENAVYRALRAEGLSIGGEALRLPEPVLNDDRTAEAERAALIKAAGSKRRAEDLVRESLTAPFVLKTPKHGSSRSEVLGRGADLVFVVYGDLDRLDTTRLTVGDQQPVEAANMRFETTEVRAEDLKARGVEPLGDDPEGGRREWAIHSTGRLLDKVHVEATNRVVLTRSKDSILIASRTSPEFRGAGPSPNRWWSIKLKGSREEKGPEKDYEGGGGYIKISRLKTRPGALFVEAHFLYAEPRAWFGGAPVLSSKMGVVAQDQIRKLRRDAAAKRGDVK